MDYLIIAPIGARPCANRLALMTYVKLALLAEVALITCANGRFTHENTQKTCANKLALALMGVPDY